MTPAVSICIPAYNHGRFLKAAIDSARAQTFRDVEIVVSDNRSTDDTAAVVAAQVREDSRVRYELAPQHVGMAENFSRSVALARGRYVKMLCSDDLLERECVAKLVAALEQSNAVLAGCARSLLDDASGRVTGVARYAAGDWSGPGEEAARRCFYYGNLIGEPTAVLFRRSDAAAGFDHRYSQLVDLDLWLRLLERGRFAFVAEALCQIRVHPAQVTRQSAASGRITADKRQLFLDYARKPYMQGNAWQRMLWDFRMAWSLQREPAERRGARFDEALYFPRLWCAMRAGAALAWPLKRGA